VIAALLDHGCADACQSFIRFPVRPRKPPESERGVAIDVHSSDQLCVCLCLGPRVVTEAFDQTASEGDQLVGGGDTCSVITGSERGLQTGHRSFHQGKPSRLFLCAVCHLMTALCVRLPGLCAICLPNVHVMFANRLPADGSGITWSRDAPKWEMTGSEVE
jgi:hypothetical protein